LGHAKAPAAGTHDLVVTRVKRCAKHLHSPSAAFDLGLDRSGAIGTGRRSS